MNFILGSKRPLYFRPEWYVLNVQKDRSQKVTQHTAAVLYGTRPLLPPNTGVVCALLSYAIIGGHPSICYPPHTGSLVYRVYHLFTAHGTTTAVSHPYRNTILKLSNITSWVPTAHRVCLETLVKKTKKSTHKQPPSNGYARMGKNHRTQRNLHHHHPYPRSTSTQASQAQ